MKAQIYTYPYIIYVYKCKRYIYKYTHCLSNSQTPNNNCLQLSKQSICGLSLWNTLLYVWICVNMFIFAQLTKILRMGRMQKNSIIQVYKYPKLS